MFSQVVFEKSFKHLIGCVYQELPGGWSQKCRHLTAWQRGWDKHSELVLLAAFTKAFSSSVSWGNNSNNLDFQGQICVCLPDADWLTLELVERVAV